MLPREEFGLWQSSATTSVRAAKLQSKIWNRETNVQFNEFKSPRR
jgi:hypothetical protein